jgi:putative flavoprotein involved in K+ transport
MPRSWLGIPIPALAYGIPWPNRIYPRPRSPARVIDTLGRLLERLIWGDLSRVGLVPPDEGVQTMLNRTGHGNATDSGMIAAVRAGRIEVLPAVTSFDADDVVLADGRSVHPEVVIAATGYRQGLEGLVGHLPVLEADGRPAINGAVELPAAPGLFMIGFHLPISGQLPELRRDAIAIARAIRARLGRS